MPFAFVRSHLTFFAPLFAFPAMLAACGNHVEIGGNGVTGTGSGGSTAVAGSQGPLPEQGTMSDGAYVHLLCDRICEGCPHGKKHLATDRECPTMCLGDFEVSVGCRDVALARLECEATQDVSHCDDLDPACEAEEQAWEDCLTSIGNNGYGAGQPDLCDIYASGSPMLEAKCVPDNGVIECSCRREGVEVGTCTWAADSCWSDAPDVFEDAFVACCFDVFYP